jgi:hypothetical protein
MTSSCRSPDEEDESQKDLHTKSQYHDDRTRRMPAPISPHTTTVEDRTAAILEKEAEMRKSKNCDVACGRSGGDGVR